MKSEPEREGRGKCILSLRRESSNGSHWREIWARESLSPWSDLCRDWRELELETVPGWRRLALQKPERI